MSVHASDDSYHFTENICNEIKAAVIDNLGVPAEEDIQDIVNKLKSKNISKDILSTVMGYCNKGMKQNTPFMKTLDETLGLVCNKLDQIQEDKIQEEEFDYGRANSDYYFTQSICYGIMDAVKKNNSEVLSFECLESFVNKIKVRKIDDVDLSQMFHWCIENIPYGTAYWNSLLQTLDRIWLIYNYEEEEDQVSQKIKTLVDVV